MSDAAARRREAIASRKAVVGLLIVSLGALVAPLDSAVNIAFPDMTRHFGLALDAIRWVPIFYVLTYASLLLVSGRLGDLIGYRTVFQIGQLVCLLGFVACSMAPAFGLLLLGRVLQGIGIALVLSCSPALATSLFGEGERTRVLGFLAATTALGSAIGPIAGGVLVEHYGWPSVFWARIPLVATALALSFVLPKRPGGGATSGVDRLGGMQLAAGLCAILGGVSVPRGAIGLATQLGLVGLGFLMLAWFLVRQARHPSPIIRPALFRDPVFALMNIASAIANLAAFSVVLVVPYYLIGTTRLGTGAAGVVLAIAAAGTILGSLVATRATRSIGGLGAAGLGMGLSSAGLFAISAWTSVTPVWLMAPALLVQGLGLGLFQVAYTDLVTATLPQAERGVAGSLAMLTRSIGIAGGASALLMLHGAFAMGGGTDEAAGQEAFMAGFQAVFVGAASLQLVALAVGSVAIRVGRRRKRRE